MDSRITHEGLGHIISFRHASVLLTGVRLDEPLNQSAEETHGPHVSHGLHGAHELAVAGKPERKALILLKLICSYIFYFILLVSSTFKNLLI
jgi:hypothetical protein